MKIQSLVQGGRFSNGKYYAVPTGASRESTIKMYSDILNDLLHEFSPPPGSNLMLVCLLVHAQRHANTRQHTPEQ
jgi:hypothetical protein